MVYKPSPGNFNASGKEDGHMIYDWTTAGLAAGSLAYAPEGIEGKSTNNNNKPSKTYY